MQGYDRYAYVNNNPLRYTDPTGHMRVDDGGSGGTSCGGQGQPSCGGVPSSGGGGGGPSGGLDGGGCTYHVGCSSTGLIDAYNSGWQNFRQAGSILSNPNANWRQRGFALGYMWIWGGNHAAFVIGSGGLACAATGPGCVGVVEGALGIGGGANVTCGGDMCASELSPMGETLWRFSERDGSFYQGLKSGEEAMSAWRASSFSSPLEAFKAMAPNGDPSTALYQTTTVGTSLMNSVYPVLEGPYGHVGLYFSNEILMLETVSSNVQAIFSAAQSVLP